MCFAFNNEFKAGGVVNGELKVHKFKLANSTSPADTKRVSKRFFLKTQVGLGASYLRRVLNRLMFEDESI